MAMMLPPKPAETTQIKIPALPAVSEYNLHKCERPTVRPTKKAK